MNLVTGHRGFIGTHLCRSLERYEGIDIREGRNILTTLLPKKDFQFIFHLAAQSDVQSSWEDPLHDLDNLRITARLVHEFPSARIIYANSSASQKRSSPYGFSKWASAEYIKQFHKDYVICTLPNVWGEGSRSVVDKFRNLNSVTIFGDGLQTRSYVHVDDIIVALLRARDWKMGEYFLGNGIATTVLQLAQNKRITFAPAKQEDYEVVLPNTTPNWMPRIPLPI